MGNVTLARKAWKKRRRSGSPLLVPCSILSVDEKSMVQWNILYLLQKYGMPLTKVQKQQCGIHSRNDVCLSMKDINRYYERHLKSSLEKHARALGYDTPQSLVKEIFNEETQKDLGIRLWLPPRNESDDSSGNEDDLMWLMAPLSRHRAQRMASQAALLQFASNDNEDEGVNSESKQGKDTESSNSENRMQHTGILRVRKKENDKKLYSSVPLSAALRVSQRAFDQGSIINGSIHDAVVLSLDETGDGGSPLMILSLNPSRQQVKDRLKLKAAGERLFSKSQLQAVGDADRNFSELKVGDGPIKAKVVSLSTRSGAAFVDCGVERTTKDGNIRILGMLRFDDLVESTLNQNGSPTVVFSSNMSDEEAQLIEDVTYDGEEEDWDDDEEEDDDDDITTAEDLMFFADDDDIDDDEEEEEMDITHLISTEDGVMLYRDPETGETVIISDASMQDDDFEDEDDDEEEDKLFKNMSPEERLDMISKIMNDREDADVKLSKEDERQDEDESSDATSTSTDSYEPSFVKTGDELDVYIKSVFKQSGRFMVTLDPSVRGRKAKDMKKESEIEKKLTRLAEKLGGLDRIMELEGTECDGVVQAISKTGDWCYVKPSIDELPVGVAKLSSEDINVAKGDSVRVRMDGIDETRGQLAMTVI